MIEAAKSGSAKASIRKAAAPLALMSATGVSKPIISGANTYMMTPINAMTTIPELIDIAAKERQRLRRPAPML